MLSLDQPFSHNSRRERERELKDKQMSGMKSKFQRHMVIKKKRKKGVERRHIKQERERGRERRRWRRMKVQSLAEQSRVKAIREAADPPVFCSPAC